MINYCLPILQYHIIFIFRKYLYSLIKINSIPQKYLILFCKYVYFDENIIIINIQHRKKIPCSVIKKKYIYTKYCKSNNHFYEIDFFFILN